MSDLPQLIMTRSLASLPALKFPPGVSCKHFSDGMEADWTAIATESFVNPYDFDKFMRADTAYKPERVLFVCVDEKPVATASAWTAKRFPDIGYIHMVGALPGYQGRKLGYWVTLAAMYKLVEDGFTQVVLETDDYRLAAIKTYLNLGYEIDFTSHESFQKRWDEIIPLLRR